MRGSGRGWMSVVISEANARGVLVSRKYREAC